MGLRSILIIMIYEFQKKFLVQVRSNFALLWEMLTFFYAHCIIKVVAEHLFTQLSETALLHLRANLAEMGARRSFPSWTRSSGRLPPTPAKISFQW